jgi:hypothetical protein
MPPVYGNPCSILPAYTSAQKPPTYGLGQLTNPTERARGRETEEEGGRGRERQCEEEAKGAKGRGGERRERERA